LISVAEAQDGKEFRRLLPVSSGLSDLVWAKIRDRFPPAEHQRVETLLLQYAFGREVERVHLDILEICDSDVEKVRKLVELANQDYRDLIVASEYEVIRGELVLKEKFKKPNSR
jgi:hypothetical protein